VEDIAGVAHRIRHVEGRVLKNPVGGIETDNCDPTNDEDDVDDSKVEQLTLPEAAGAEVVPAALALREANIGVCD
jgi:hypothetical protein